MGMAPPNPRLPKFIGGTPAPTPCAGAGELPSPAFPKIETRSSRGLLECPERRLAAAGVFATENDVAARPEGCVAPSGDVGSSKLRRFSAC